MGEPILQVNDLACGYDGRPVLEHVSFSVEAGQVLCILGPNGVGKTTLFKTVLGFNQVLSGAMMLDGQDVSGLTRRQFAQVVAYIPQQHTPTFSFSVRDFVLMGRTPALGAVEMPGAQDEEIADQALARMGLDAFADRDYTLLSGGEQQLVLIARALAQQPKLLVMDEPCSSLDLGNQVRVIEQVLDLAAEGLGVIMTTHDPNHALMCDGDVLCLSRDGCLHGKARELIDEELLGRLYGIHVGIARVPGGGSGDGVRGCIPLLSGYDGVPAVIGAPGE